MDNFEKTIRKHVELLDDNQFAQEVYAGLCNVEWTHDSGKKYSCTWRYAGDLVAGFRCSGEDYMCFYCSGNEGKVSKRFRELMASEGWHPHVEDTEEGYDLPCTD